MGLRPVYSGGMWCQKLITWILCLVVAKIAPPAEKMDDNQQPTAATALSHAIQQHEKN